MRWYETEDGPVNNARTVRGRILRNHFWLTLGSIGCGEVKDAMNRVKRKLKNQTGASITFALLLFLVCAVLSSVIIVAATAASGRMSKIAETDQRYYAVTSAAELLKNLFKEPHDTVSVVEVIETPYTITYTDGVADPPVTGTPVTKVYIVADKKAAEISKSDYKNDDDTDKTDVLLKVDGVVNASFKNDTLQKDAAKNVYDDTPLNDRGLTIESTFFSDADLDYDALSVTIKEKLDTNGNLQFTLYNSKNAKGALSTEGDQYRLEMEFDADKSITPDSPPPKYMGITSVSETVYTEEWKKTDITITTLIWMLNEIRTNP